jgi:hypothetical protein
MELHLKESRVIKIKLERVKEVRDKKIVSNGLSRLQIYPTSQFFIFYF